MATIVPEGVKRLLGLAKTVNDARANFVSGLRTLRDNIAKWKQERAEVVSLPVTLAAAETRVDEWLDAEIGRMIRNLQGNYLAPPKPELFACSPSEWINRNHECNVPALMAFYLRDELATAIKARLAETYTSLEPISDEDRSARLAALDRDILEAEVSEEEIIRLAETSGFRADRRKDADPRAVLHTWSRV